RTFSILRAYTGWRLKRELRENGFTPSPKRACRFERSPKQSADASTCLSSPKPPRRHPSILAGSHSSSAATRRLQARKRRNVWDGAQRKPGSSQTWSVQRNSELRLRSKYPPTAQIILR